MQLLFSALTTQSANIAEEGRSLAAVMIRRVITAEFSEFFPKLSAEQQASFKSDLLVVLQQEPSRTVRKKLADLVAELARSLIDDEGNNMWPEFLKFLFELASSANPDMKEAALRIFAAVPAVFGNQVRNTLLVFFASIYSHSETSKINLANLLLGNFRRRSTSRSLRTCS